MRGRKMTHGTMVINLLPRDVKIDMQRHWPIGHGLFYFYHSR